MTLEAKLPGRQPFLSVWVLTDRTHLFQRTPLFSPQLLLTPNPSIIHSGTQLVERSQVSGPLLHFKQKVYMILVKCRT